MKIKVYGFRIDRKQMPKAMGIADVYSAIESNSGKSIDKKGLIRMSATSVNWKYDKKPEDWWAGMILRARDAKSYNQIKRIGGKLKLTSQQLEGGQIAEICFFVANRNTGSGLLASYHTGPGLPTFMAFTKRLFNIERKNRIMEALNQKMKVLDKVKLRSQYVGKLKIQHLILGDDLGALLRELKSVSSMEVHYAAVAPEKGERFARFKAKAETEVLKLAFPLGFALDDEMTEELLGELSASEKTRFKVFGMNDEGVAMPINSETIRNKMIFAEVDYDEMLGDLELNLDDWAPTIQGSDLVKWLLQLTNRAEIRMKLNT